MGLSHGMGHMAGVAWDDHMGWSHGMVTWDGSHEMVTWAGNMGWSHVTICPHGIVTWGG